MEHHIMSHNTPLASTTNFGLIKVGTGLSVTDGLVTATPGLLNYGFFTDGTQTNPVASAVNITSFTNSGPANGISVVGGTNITVVNAGVYTKMFTVMVSKTSGGTSSVSFWLRYNGIDVAGSRQDLELINTLVLVFASGNYTIAMTAGSYIQLCWSSADTTVALTALPTAIAPTRPAGDSVKVTLTRIS
jgi:hypothetical protein